MTVFFKSYSKLQIMLFKAVILFNTVNQIAYLNARICGSTCLTKNWFSPMGKEQELDVPQYART